MIISFFAIVLIWIKVLSSNPKRKQLALIHYKTSYSESRLYILLREEFCRKVGFLFLSVQGGLHEKELTILEDFKDLVSVLERKLRCRILIGISKIDNDFLRFLVIMTKSFSRTRILRRLFTAYRLLQNIIDLYGLILEPLNKYQLKQLFMLWNKHSIILLPQIKRKYLLFAERENIATNLSVDKIWKFATRFPEYSCLIADLSIIRTHHSPQKNALSGRNSRKPPQWSETIPFETQLVAIPRMIIRVPFSKLLERTIHISELENAFYSLFLPLTATSRYIIKTKRIGLVDFHDFLTSLSSRKLRKHVLHAIMGCYSAKLFFKKFSEEFLKFFITFGERVNLDSEISETFSKGDIFIGYQLRRGLQTIPFFLTLDDLKRHLLILGPSGQGKTTLAKIIVEEIRRKFPDIKIWIIDFHGEYVNFRKEGFKVVSPGSLDSPLAINIFDPQSENAETYAIFLTNLLIEVMKTTLEPLSAQMERFLSMAVFETIRDPKGNPLLFLENLWSLCNQFIDDLPSSIQTFHAIINRLRSIFSGIMQRVFWVSSTNFSVKEMLNHNIILDLSNLVKRGALKRDLMLLTNILLRYMISEVLNMQNNNYPSSLKYLVVIEEGRYIAPWRRRDIASETTTLEDFAVLARKYGIALCTISQSPNVLSEDIIENCGTLFIMGGEPPEKERGTLDESILKYLITMPPGEAIVKLSTTPAILHIRVEQRDMNNTKQDEILESNDSFSEHLRARYNPLNIPFEYAVRKIIEGEKLFESAIIRREKENSVFSDLLETLIENYGVDNPRELKVRIRDQPEILLGILRRNVTTNSPEEIKNVLEAIYRSDQNENLTSSIVFYLDLLDIKHRLFKTLNEE